MIKKSKKKLIWIILIIFSIIFFATFIVKPQLSGVKNFLKREMDPKLFSILQFFYNIERSSKKLNNDYNVKFLPETQITNLKFTKSELEFPDTDTAGYAQNLKVKVKQVFYIEKYLDKLIILSSNGSLFFNNYEQMVSKGKLRKINTNLNLMKTLDLLIDDGNIFISGYTKSDNCSYLEIHKAEISRIDDLNFSKIFKSSECVNVILSGRLGKLRNKDSLFLTTAADVFKNNEMDNKPQDDNSIYGKILKIDLVTNNYEIFSKGHRNILGLYIDNEIILSTENGPRGGDEINNISYGKNYGWPIVSYGEKYKNNEHYPNSHSEYGFEEPIYSFIPSVGISQIEKVDKKFSNKWKDNFLAASLNGNHIYRLKFDKDYKKVFFVEKIFVGERMRDLVYYEKQNVFLIALESTGSLGILKQN